MPSIRIRIILLTFFSLLFLLFAIVNEYLHVENDVLTSQKSLSVVEKLSCVSQLIHSLQKERGLTSIYLLNHDIDFYDKLTQQRKITDSKLKSNQEFVDLSSNIQKIRNSVDANASNANEIRCDIIKGLYTVEIDKLLLNISLELTELRHAKEISHQLYAILYLLKARENLGILRADTLCYYEKNKLSQSEILKSSYQFDIFIGQLDYFKAHIKKTPYDASKYQNDEFLKPVKLQIASIVKEGKLLDRSSSLSWWTDMTSAIDSMKKTEDTIFKKIKEYSQHNIHVNERNLFWYLTVALVALLLISVLTISTVVRILRASSSLISSLNKVEQTQDFSLRLCVKSKDEFGQLSSSVNKLLSYTNQILKEKERLASIDLLTGLMNRRSFIAIAEKEIARSNRHGQPLSLIFCDIDNFKFINDNHGHNVGDDVLKSFANILSLYIRKNDYLARWGGEEFLVLAPETNEAQAAKLAESLRQMTEKLCMQKINGITCSFGVAQLKKNESLESLHKRADHAMYSAKKLGRNQVCVASANDLRE
ncbi:diguanylate cyclase [Sulfurimonas sp.]|uniref:diguanylate cyclase n=1 Tax=Sulfurimonas sp. TaxID=2022749 RepID=UPI00356B56D4